MDVLLAGLAVWVLGNTIGAAVWVLLRHVDVPAACTDQPAVAPSAPVVAAAPPAPRAATDEAAARPSTRV